MKYSTYTNGVIIYSDYPVVEFIEDEEVELTTVEFDGNRRINSIHYPPNSNYNSIPQSNCEIVDFVEGEAIINLPKIVNLHPFHVVNGLEFHLKNYEGNGYVFSSFIDTDTSKIEFGESEVGGWVQIPSEYPVIEDFNDKLLAKINSSSMFFARGEFSPANILGVDLNDKRVKGNWDNTVPYGSYERIYVNESDVVYNFIRTMKEAFPEIEFYPQSSERKNFGKETCYYRTILNRDKSEKHNSIVIKDAEYNRVIQTTIPMEMRYQTNDISQYSDRRTLYLLSRFFMDVQHFTVTKQKGYTDRFGESTETFDFAIYWTRNVEDELIRQDSADMSGRDTYTLTIYCDLICILMQSSQYYNTIQDVIKNIYLTSDN